MIIAQKFSLRPDKLVLYNEITHSNRAHSGDIENYNPVNVIAKSNTDKSDIKKITKKFHNFEISKNANKTMREKINWLYYLSKNRYKKTYTGKSIYNYKLSFVTLTLPSTQIHTTAFITKNIFNQFLTEIRTRSGMNNYVWRLEFQKNRNVHYHLVTDAYLDYHFILKIWNRIINKFGYVDSYAQRFRNMNLSKYNEITNKYNKIDFDVIKKRYAKGIKSKWMQPNSVDVKSVVSNKAIGNYIAKYFSKDSDADNKCNSLDNEKNSFSLRLWFCSRTLSKLKSVNDYIEAVPYNAEYVLKKCSELKYVYHKYVTVVYYKMKLFSSKFGKFISKLLRNYANEVGYISSV